MKDSVNRRLESARAENRELRARLRAVSVVVANLPSSFVNGYEALCWECEASSKTNDDLGTVVNIGGSGSRPPNVNAAALNEKRRVDARLDRIGNELLGDPNTGDAGRLERLIHSKSSSNTKWERAG